MSKNKRIVARPFPTTPDMSVSAITARFCHGIAQFSGDDAAPCPDEDDILVMLGADFAAANGLDDDEDDGASPNLPSGWKRAAHRAVRFVQRRNALLDRHLAHLNAADSKLIRAVIGRGTFAGVVTQHQMHERIAALHEDAPWMQPASVAVMHAMNRATRTGAAGLTMPPLILSGPPGVGKSQWARSLARLFRVPVVDIDIGASNGATFALSGTERGWGSAAPGRLVGTMLQTQIANPLVIVDELDKIPDAVSTNKGTSLPGAVEVLKSMIEPTTARHWTCPYYRVPFDMSSVNWVMTTNSTAALSQALLDRCTLIELRDPTTEELACVARKHIRASLPDDMHGIANDLVRGALRQRQAACKRTSLRQLARMIQAVTDLSDVRVFQ
ncbi:AAA family ATPase [Paracoccus sp. (in: a-proteobacteria)]|uniref:AAA family ATPase n=1 Tax=Paracoccus sp. TaxID=267 RepID=UPI0026DEFA01|nr:AAA family ATPase [Paracoccus sp. (in: a-proteobacteria)]MDO5648007.1 AAA family ATPase [Paracoccus sp. (in: a-proteobacteria)]